MKGKAAILMAGVLLVCAECPRAKETGLQATLACTPSIGVVGEVRHLEVILNSRGGSRINKQDVSLVLFLPGGGEEVVPSVARQNDASNAISVQADYTPKLSGFYGVTVNVRSAEGKQERISVERFPVLERPISVVYFEGPKSTRYLTHRVCTDEEAQYWNARGVRPLKWMPGITHRKWNAEEFYERWSQPLADGFAGIAIDEFRGTGGTPTVEMSEALMRLQSQSHLEFAAVWTISLDGCGIEAKAFREAADLVMLECYVDQPGRDYRFEELWKATEQANIEDRTIFALWLGRVITSERELDRQMGLVRAVAPVSRGVCLNGKYSPELGDSADKLVEKWFLKPVLVLEKKGGSWRCRNIGWMTAWNVEFSPGNRTQNVRVEKIQRGEVVELGVPSSDSLTILPAENYTWLDQWAENPDKKKYEPVLLGDGTDLFAAMEEMQSPECLRIPLDGKLFQRPFRISFEIEFLKTDKPYGVVAVGLGNQNILKYEESFFERFPAKGATGNRLEIKFYRGDLELRQGDGFRGVCGFFGFENRDGQFVRSAATRSLEAGNRYAFHVDVNETDVEFLIADGADGERPVWSSEKLPLATAADFNEIFFRVRDTGGGTVAFTGGPVELISRDGGREVTSAQVHKAVVRPILIKK